MNINKKLKFGEFSYDEDSKIFTIIDREGNRAELNKVYSFAFMRFVIRMAQRNWLKQLKKPQKKLDTTPLPVVELDPSEIENPNQLIFQEIN